MNRLTDDRLARILQRGVQRTRGLAAEAHPDPEIAGRALQDSPEAVPDEWEPAAVRQQRRLWKVAADQRMKEPHPRERGEPERHAHVALAGVATHAGRAVRDPAERAQ